MRKSHTKELKFKVASEAIKVDLTIVQIASKYGIATSCVHKWKQEFLREGSVVFDRKRGPQPPKDEIAKLHATIGRLKVGERFFRGSTLHFSSKLRVQFTSKEWLDLLEAYDVEASHSGAGRSNDNAHIERLWRSLKYEYLFIHGCRSVEAVKEGVGKFIRWYNDKRPHQALGYKTPKKVMEARAEGLAPLPSSLEPE